ncbi:polyprenyl diphosphate synthase [Thiobacillus denitrificans]|uniref:polyprenyl diphosphate synthase n=1 Tax=Thiobacillus denitrificans TaxID=36861 RepID=UPI000360AA51|nr:polyprenyl diphosphate synthase [Thiobacillus denitrificans]
MATRSKQAIPASADVPRHIAIIMDGNGRWAKRRLMPRVAGHRKGVEALRGVIRACAERGVSHLTVFAFSSENWRRPQEEVSLLMELFMRALENEVARLHENDIRFRVIGDLSGFSERIQSLVSDAEALTRNNARLTFTVAANYGGRWDIVQTVKKLMASSVAPEAVSEAALAQQLSMADLPEPDLFIRTGGEQRISNFLLWQLAYTELHFTNVLWPDFDAVALDAAIASYRTRERRFGRTSEQVSAAS